jgi:hypothetical protein
MHALIIFIFDYSLLTEVGSAIFVLYLIIYFDML